MKPTAGALQPTATVATSMRVRERPATQRRDADIPARPAARDRAERFQQRALSK
jgi:hypothetical protein